MDVISVILFTTFLFTKFEKEPQNITVVSKLLFELDGEKKQTRKMYVQFLLFIVVKEDNF